MRNKTKGTIIRWSATALCVGAPLGTTLSQFPVWIATSDRATMSGLFLVLAFICCLPFANQIKAYLKSPAIWVVWSAFLVLFLALRNIIDQMVIVCLVGLISNIAGALLYKLGDHIKEKPDKKESDIDGDGTA